MGDRVLPSSPQSALINPTAQHRSFDSSVPHAHLNLAYMLVPIQQGVAAASWGVRFFRGRSCASRDGSGGGAFENSLEYGLP